jgi:hypothetical protein
MKYWLSISGFLIEPVARPSESFLPGLGLYSITWVVQYAVESLGDREQDCNPGKAACSPDISVRRGKPRVFSR